MDTREQILGAAWELYAARGFEDVSVRDVTQAAGVNLASVSYHFGCKDGLVQETIKRCMNLINRHRYELLGRQIDRHEGLEKLSLRAVLAAYLRPLVLPEECGVPSALWLRLVARYLIQPDYQIPAESRELGTETYALFVKALKVHFPESSSEAILRHLMFVSGAATYERGLGKLVAELSGQLGIEKHVVEDRGDDGKDANREQSLSDLIEFAIRGFGGDTHEADMAS